MLYRYTFRDSFVMTTGVLKNSVLDELIKVHGAILEMMPVKFIEPR